MMLMHVNNGALTQTGSVRRSLLGVMLLLTTCLALFGPKYPLVIIPSINQDLRAEDIAAVFAFVILAARHGPFLNRYFLYKPKSIIYFLCFTLMTWPIIFLTEISKSFLTPILVIRIFEVYILAGSTYILAERYPQAFRLLVKALFIACFLSIAYSSLFEGRSRLRFWFSGPWEYGTITIFLSLALYFQTYNKFYKIAILLITLVGLVLIGGRIQIGTWFATVIVLCAFDHNLFSRITRNTIKFVIMTIFLFITLVLVMNIESIFQSVSNGWEFISLYDISDFNNVVNEASSSIDPSLFERILIWKRIYSGWYENLPISAFIGLGLASNGIVIDGMHVRIIFETGFIGALLFYFYLFQLAKSDFYLFVAVFVLVFVGITNEPLSALKLLLAFLFSLIVAHVNPSRKIV
jgi:hypothetical protein